MKKERNYGIDLLRIVAMFFVCLLHVLRFGGILGGARPLSAQYEVAWFLETAAFCAVNCYALISGYVGINGQFRLSNLIQLWLQVVFYAFGLYVAELLLKGQSISVTTMIKSLLPVSSSMYWYFTAYFCAFFFFPAVNWVVNNMPRAKLRLCVYACLFLFCGLAAVRNPALFGLSSGYSALWLLVLYFFGCYIRKFNCFSNWSIRKALLVYFGCVLLGWLWRWADEAFWQWRKDLFCQYVSPNILLAAVALLIACAKLKPGMKLRKLIALAAPLSFAVYIIHLHPVIQPLVLTGKYAFLADGRVWELPLGALAASALMFCGCAAIDWLRIKLFELLRIKKLSTILGDRIEKAVRGFRAKPKKTNAKIR